MAERPGECACVTAERPVPPCDDNCAHFNLDRGCYCQHCDFYRRRRGESRLVKRPPVKSPGNWQAIDDSTPREDGREMLLGSEPDGWVCAGRWVDDGHGGDWFEVNNDPGDARGSPLSPTHWQPMPKPPRTKE